jgi:threonine synthase
LNAAELTLRCWACGRPSAFDPFTQRCPDCGEALELAAADPPPALEPPFGAGMPAVGSGEGLWRYRPAFPGCGARLVAERVFMGEGGTPLLHAQRLGRALGFESLWLKDETRNPTGSFKDRGTAAAVAALAGLGFTAVGTVSTGNMARSVAAYAARAGMEATVWVGAGTPAGKLAATAVHGARLQRFAAPYGEIYAASFEWSRRHGVPFVNSDSALRVEGQKTIAYEIAEQFGGEAPDWLLIPTSSGGNLSAIAKGFAEAVRWGWIDGACRLVAVQAEGCAPIARGWEAGSDEPAAVPEPETIAGAISNPTPPSGRRAIRWLRDTQGCAIAVPDDEIEAAQLRMAELTGRYVQPASAAGLAALSRLGADGTVAPGDTVVLLLTGAGGNAAPPSIDLPAPGSLAELE